MVPGLLVLAVLAFLVGGITTESCEVFPRLRFAIQRAPADLPSSRVTPMEEVAAGWPLMSLYLDHRHLHDPLTGLLQNLEERGRDWERPGSLSYFDEGRLRFASGVSVRIHGGISRRISPVQSFKVYLRGKRGADRFAPGVLFDGEVDPLRRFILHNDLRADPQGRYWHFQNPLAYDIVKQIGGLAPRTKPVRFFLNGEWQGVYVATEKIDVNVESPYLIGNFGHDDFAVTHRDFEVLRQWLQRRTPWTLESVSEVVDVENLTRWFLAVLFCATEDPFQGAQLRDNRDPDGRWSWISWDMDHSFMDFNGQVEAPWEHDTFRTVFARAAEAQRERWPTEVRSTLLTTLVAEDEGYRRYFKTLFVDMMNHRLTDEFLSERFAYYEAISRDYGITDTEYLGVLSDFLKKRPAHLRDLAEQYMNTDPSTTLRIEGPAGITVVVDGHEVGSEFTGYYFPDMTVSVAVAERDRSRVSHWLANGDRLELSDQPLTLPTARSLELRAVAPS